MIKDRAGKAHHPQYHLVKEECEGKKDGNMKGRVKKMRTGKRVEKSERSGQFKVRLLKKIRKSDTEENRGVVVGGRREGEAENQFKKLP